MPACLRKAAPVFLLLAAAAAAQQSGGLPEVVRLQREGRYAEAWDACVELYTAGDRSPVLLRYLQSLGLRLGKYPELTEILRLSERSGLSLGEELLWAEILLRQGRADEGLAVLRAAVGRSGASRAPQAVSLLKARGMEGEALQLAQEQRAQVAPGEPPWRVLSREIITLLCRAGRTSECVREALSYVAADPHSSAWAARTVRDASDLSPDLVREAFDTAHPSPHSRALAARLLLALGDAAGGARLLAAGERVNAASLIAYGEACLGERDVEAAAQAFLEAKANASSTAETLAAIQGLMTSGTRSGDLPTAARHAEELLTLAADPRLSGGAHVVISMARLAEGRAGEAIEHAERARSTAERSQAALAMWVEAEARLTLGESEEARELYAEVARLWPSDSLANDCLARVAVLSSACPGVPDFGKGVGLRWRGRLRAAASAFATAAAECPGSLLRCEATLEAARSLLEAGDPEAAQSLLETTEAESLCAPKSLLETASILHAAGRTDRAVEKLERLLLEFPGSPQVIPGRRELARMRAGRNG
jgi:tetratricopeptide (TPR) repeat protein